MLADIGTKALEPAQFELLRDVMTGYGLWAALKQGKMNEFVLLMIQIYETKQKAFSMKKRDKK
jgi:hypothetical protein